MFDYIKIFLKVPKVLNLSIQKLAPEFYRFHKLYLKIVGNIIFNWKISAKQNR